MVEGLEETMVVALVSLESLVHLSGVPEFPHSLPLGGGNSLDSGERGDVLGVGLSDLLGDVGDLSHDPGDDISALDVEGLDDSNELVQQSSLITEGEPVGSVDLLNKRLNVSIVEALALDVLTLDELSIQGTNIDPPGLSSHLDNLNFVLVVMAL